MSEHEVFTTYDQEEYEFYKDSGLPVELLIRPDESTETADKEAGLGMFAFLKIQEAKDQAILNLSDSPLSADFSPSDAETEELLREVDLSPHKKNK